MDSGKDDIMDKLKFKAENIQVKKKSNNNMDAMYISETKYIK